MSWSSRFGSWSGRFSPFGRSSSPSSAQVTDSDFSYITSEDLARHQNQTTDPRAGRRVESPLSPSGEDDILILKHRRVSYPLHFPAGTIDNGEITIGVLRIAAARKLDVKDARKVKLFFKGRNLKDDRRLARDEGFRSGAESEILCVVGEANTIGADGGYIAEDAAASDGDSGSDDASRQGDGKKKRKNRRGKKKKTSKATASSTADGYSSGPQPKPSEYLPAPGAAFPPRPTSAPPQPTAKPFPTDPLGQLAALDEKFQTELRPMCEEFIDNPPADKAKRDFNHKRLTETLLQQILLKLDGVETAGVEGAREKRKALVRDCQTWLNKLDEVVN